MGSGHVSEMGNLCGLKVWVSAGIHGNGPFKTFDDGKRLGEAGAAVQVRRRSWKLVKAQIQVRRCDAAPISRALQGLNRALCNLTYLR